jgi:hypothetical protein
VRLAEIRARQGASDEAAELRRRARALWADGDGNLEEILESGQDTADAEKRVDPTTR